MKTTPYSSLLNQPINELEFSKEFKLITELLGFHSLNDLLNHNTKDLEKLPGFNINLINEYIYFMLQNGLGQYIDV